MTDTERAQKIDQGIRVLRRRELEDYLYDLADRAALLTRAAKRDIDRDDLRRSWERQAAGLGFSAAKVRANARKAERGLLGPDLFAGPDRVADDAVSWAVGHLAERQAGFGHADLPAATLARRPGS